MLVTLVLNYKAYRATKTDTALPLGFGSGKRVSFKKCAA